MSNEMSTPSAANDQAEQVAAKAADQAQQVAHTARDQASRLTNEASVQASKVLEDAKSHLHEQAKAQTDQLGEVLSRLTGNLQALSEGRPEDGGPVSDATRQALRQAERITIRVQEGGFDGMVADVKRFARRRPGVFLAAAVSAGFVVGRLIRGGQESGALGAAISGNPDSQMLGDGADPPLGPATGKARPAASPALPAYAQTERPTNPATPFAGERDPEALR